VIVVDSSVWIDNIRNDATPQVQLLRRADTDQVIVGDLVVLEVLRGFRTDAEAAIHEQRFRALGITPLSTPQIAVTAASKFRELRARGITIRSSIEVVIATYCIENDHHLLHSDRDFDHFERHLGLKVWRQH
jgi:predicted nucleic acid-binding protein